MFIEFAEEKLNDSLFLTSDCWSSISLDDKYKHTHIVGSVLKLGVGHLLQVQQIIFKLQHNVIFSYR